MNFKLKGKFLAIIILTLTLVMVLDTSVFAIPTSDRNVGLFLEGMTPYTDEMGRYSFTISQLLDYPHTTTGVLDLYGYNVRGGIAVFGGDVLEINLLRNSTNTINLNYANGSNPMTGLSMHGIYYEKDLIIAGNGTLNINIDATDVYASDIVAAIETGRNVVIRDSATVNINVRGFLYPAYGIKAPCNIQVEEAATLNIIVENEHSSSVGIFSEGLGIYLDGTGDKTITMKGAREHIAIQNDEREGMSHMGVGSNLVRISGESNLEINLPENKGKGITVSDNSFGEIEILNGASVVINSGEYGIYDIRESKIYRATESGAIVPVEAEMDGENNQRIKIKDSNLTIKDSKQNGIYSQHRGLNIRNSDVNITAIDGSAIYLGRKADVAKIDVYGDCHINLHSQNNSEVVRGVYDSNGGGVSNIDLRENGEITLTSNNEDDDSYWKGLVKFGPITYLKQGVDSTPDLPSEDKYSEVHVYRAEVPEEIEPPHPGM